MKIGLEARIALASLAIATAITAAGAKKQEGYIISSVGVTRTTEIMCPGGTEFPYTEIVLRSPAVSTQSVEDFLNKTKVLNSRSFYTRLLDRFPQGYFIDVTAIQSYPKVRRYGILNVNKEGNILMLDYRSKEGKGTNRQINNFTVEMRETGEKITITGEETASRALAVLATPFDERGCLIDAKSPQPFAKIRFYTLYSHEGFDKNGEVKREVNFDKYRIPLTPNLLGIK